MDARERLARASRAIEPMWQGSLDSLCGLYAVINAVQLAVYPSRRLKRVELTQLFDIGLDVLRSARALQPTLIAGMHEPLWSRVSAAVVERATALTGQQLELVRIALPSQADAFALIRHIRHNVSRGRPVLLCLEGRLNHWTVVARFSKTRLSLFDSSRHSWLLVRMLGVAGSGVAKPYSVPRHGLVVLQSSNP